MFFRFAEIFQPSPCPFTYSPVQEKLEWFCSSFIVYCRFIYIAAIYMRLLILIFKCLRKVTLTTLTSQISRNIAVFGLYGVHFYINLHYTDYTPLHSLKQKTAKSQRHGSLTVHKISNPSSICLHFIN